jgi:hypothetical protein
MWTWSVIAAFGGISRFLPGSKTTPGSGAPLRGPIETCITCGLSLRSVSSFEGAIEEIRTSDSGESSNGSSSRPQELQYESSAAVSHWPQCRQSERASALMIRLA